MTKIKYIFLFLLISPYLRGQSSAEINEMYARFNSFKTVLYLAAHPDDENTRVISWLVNGEHAQTGYLSLTRGDGGQNLIGTEFGDALGILRTQELLSARSIDGGQQFFSRAVDFGYSRSAAETLEKWGEQDILGDVVYLIRHFKPQLIITRFPPDERAGHGHHTASAMLAISAAAAAADPKQFSDQLKNVEPWQVQSVYWNTSTWWDKTVAEERDTNPSIWRADIGGYNPNLGVSYNELGSLARSQHKCQGFGAEIQRGKTYEYFRHLWGKTLPNGLNDLQTESWETLANKNILAALDAVNQHFDLKNREATLRHLAKLYAALGEMPNPYWRQRKQEECAALIKAVAGFFAEALAPDFAYQPGDTVPIQVNLLSRASTNLSLAYMQTLGSDVRFKAPFVLSKNEFAQFELMATLPNKIENPYWLQNAHGNTYELPNRFNNLLTPDNEPIATVSAQLLLYDVAIPVEIPVQYKWRDPVKGELHRSVHTVPPVCLNFSEPVYAGIKGDSIMITANLSWFRIADPQQIVFTCPGFSIFRNGKEISDVPIAISAANVDESQQIRLALLPRKISRNSTLSAHFVSGEALRGYREIAYDHIKTQVFMPVASALIVPLDVAKVGHKVAYISGAGDRVAEAISQMGYQVDILDKNTFSNAILSDYQAVVVGIRGYNTQPWLAGFTTKILEYVANGGNYIVQYNTASRFLNDEPLIPAPYPFSLGRGRVTEEDADPTFELPNHAVLNRPNKLTMLDFEGWVQERGLYFANSWDSAYAAPISWYDSGMKPELGGLLIADYGKGAFIYTGISFFRILPAGAAGGYRLLANILSYEAN